MKFAFDSTIEPKGGEDEGGDDALFEEKMKKFIIPENQKRVQKKRFEKSVKKD